MNYMMTTTLKLKPTERFILAALRQNAILNIAGLCEFTGSTPYNVQANTTRMVKKGLIQRQRIDGTSYYSLPTPDTK